MDNTPGLFVVYTNSRELDRGGLFLAQHLGGVCV